MFDEIGRAHLARCRRLVAQTRGFSEPLAEAASALPVQRLRGMTEREVAELLWVVPEAQLQGEPYSTYLGYVFHSSIFLAMAEVDPQGGLFRTAGDSAATDLVQMMLAALNDDDLEFVHAGSGLLDHFGDALDEAYFKVVARGFRAAVHAKAPKRQPSKLAELASELEIEEIRVEGLELLPLARRQCGEDEARIGMLDNMEMMLRHRP